MHKIDEVLNLSSEYELYSGYNNVAMRDAYKIGFARAKHILLCVIGRTGFNESQADFAHSRKIWEEFDKQCKEFMKDE